MLIVSIPFERPTIPIITAIDKATERGRTDLAEVLTNRLAVREQTLVVLQQRQSEVLPRLAAFCAEHGAAA